MTRFAVALFALIAIVQPQRVNAASADDFYRGKTIRVIVGFAAGGGFDQYARTIARHMPKHIAGNPTMIVDNMARRRQPARRQLISTKPARRMV